MNGELFESAFQLASDVQEAPAAPVQRAQEPDLFPVAPSFAPTGLDAWNSTKGAT
jgi:hypothetical protein